ncbi:MAG: acetoin utilization protein AcuC [Gemmatimonadetes bacterium]|nr:acetoin utilization protein AcuC [Gemmatimonadota bacterium]
MPHTAFVWDDALADYRFTPDHPLNPRRLALTLELIRRLGLFDEAHSIVPARRATDAEILTVHTPVYVDAVKRASDGSVGAVELSRFGLGSGDVPIVPGMHDAAAHIVGATLRAAELVMSGDVTRALNIAGGLHHARRSEASGFCIYNDAAAAIRWMQNAHGARVLYIDIDAHHGDGVQQIFYEDPGVLTLSFHESGTFLYPGTGFIEEMGADDGYGYSVNVPLDPHTDDESFLDCVRTLVPRIAELFGPDVIVLQAGCDAHVLDPLTHLRCTTAFYRDATRIVCDTADTHCGGRVVATGGGGYAIHQVVPRAWTLVWAALSGLEPGNAIPADYIAMLERECECRVSTTLLDPAEAFERTPLSIAAAKANHHTVDAVRRRCFPLISGWGLGF